MATGIQLKVTPEELKSKANEIKTQITKIEADWNKVSTLIDNSKSYWEGDASDMHRKSKKNIEADAQSVIKRLKEHPEDLMNMAGIYLETEEKAKQIANSLPDDIIV